MKKYIDCYINLLEARIKDNDGNQPLDTLIREDGQTAYFSNLPIFSFSTKLYSPFRYEIRLPLYL